MPLFITSRPGEVSAHSDDKWVGSCRFFHNRMHYHPRVYSLVFSTADDAARVVSALYRKVEEILAPHHPLLLRTGLEETSPLYPLLRDLGFRDYRRVYFPALDVATFDLTQLDEAARAFDDLGYSVVRLADLEWTPQVEARFYRMYNEVYADTSTAVPATPERLTREDLLELTVQNSSIIPEAFFIALNKDALIGFGNLFRSEAAGELETGTFGTVRAYRHYHRDIMLAIKAREMAYARERGYKTVRAEIDADNFLTLSVCAESPFVQGRDYVSLVRVPNWTVRP